MTFSSNQTGDPNPAWDEPQAIIGRIARSGLWSFLAYATAAASAFAVSVIIARGLGPASFGRYSFYVWILRLLPYVLTLGIPSAVTRLVSEHLGSDDVTAAKATFWTGQRFLSLLILPVALLTWLAVINAEHRPSLAVGMALGVAVLFISTNLEGLLTGLRRFRTLSKIAVSIAVIQVVLAGIGFVMGLAWPAYILLQIVGSAVGMCGFLWAAKGWLPRGEPLTTNHRKRFVSYAAVMAFGLVLDSVLWGRPEFFFLQRYRSSTELGLYAAAIRVSSLAGIMPLVAAKALIPEFSWLRGRGDDEALRTIYPRVCKMLALVGAPLAFGGAALSSVLVASFYGKPFVGAGLTAGLLLAGSFVNTLVGPASAAVLTGPRPRLMLEVGTVTAILNIALDALLIPRFGIVSAAAVNVLVQWVSVLAGLTYARLSLELRYPIRDVLRIVGIAGVSAVAARVVAGQAEGWLALASATVAGAIVYIALAFATRTVTRRELRDLLTPSLGQS